jgi:hypothetical protein
MMKKVILTVWIIGLLVALSLPVFGQTKPGLYDGDAFQGDWSLVDYAEWLQTYAKDGGNYTIFLGKDMAGNNINLDFRKKNVTVTLKSSGGEYTIKFDRNQPTGPLFTVRAGITFIIEDDVVLSGAGTNSGSLVLVTGNGSKFIMNGGTLRDSKSSAVLIQYSGDFTMNGGTITGNSVVAGYRVGGGGVRVGGSQSGQGGTFTMNDGTISGNTVNADRDSFMPSSADGGGVWIVNDNSTFTLNGGAITGNSASRGGGIYLENCNFIMTGGFISRNISRSSNSGGGGVYSPINNTFTMSGGTINGNTASNNGGGVYVPGSGTFIINGGNINGNTARNGGGVYVFGEGYWNGKFTMNGGDINGNTASVDGGGVSVIYKATFSMSNGSISRNTASNRGGGVWVSNEGTFTKSGTAGIIYGTNAANGQENKAKSDEFGHAVWAGENRIRNTTAGETTGLDKTKNRFEGGGWGE